MVDFQQYTSLYGAKLKDIIMMIRKEKELKVFGSFLF
jgi:uncharacterized membrane protein